MGGEGTLDYELYLRTKTLLSCQTKFEELCNADELQFQVVHQVEELWMKLIAYTLLDIDDYLQLIHRTIGFGSKSLKGRPVEILEEGMRHKFFPELWEIRSHMTDRWGAEYGVKRDPLGGHH